MPDTVSSWLLATLVLTFVQWLPYVNERVFSLGLARTLGNPQPGDLEEQAQWAQRSAHAHANSVENLVVFAPLALLAIHLGLDGTSLAVGASATYFGARVVHYVVYVAGIPVVRTLAFVTGWGATVALAWAVYSVG